MQRPTVVLWDIDGTLLRAPGVGVRAFVLAVERVTGVVWTPRRLDFGGQTDPAIARLILDDAGVTDPALVPLVLDAVGVAYEELYEQLRSTVVVLPGIIEAIAALAARGITQTVVTGNIRPAAMAKLSAADLAAGLRTELGSYGSDHGDRSELVRLALERVAASGIDVELDDVWVVGDTPRDLACARANRVRCALVGTGSHPIDELSGLGAELALENASTTELVDTIAGMR